MSINILDTLNKYLGNEYEQKNPGLKGRIDTFNSTTIKGVNDNPLKQLESLNDGITNQNIIYSNLIIEFKRIIDDCLKTHKGIQDGLNTVIQNLTNDKEDFIQQINKLKANGEELKIQIDEKNTIIESKTLEIENLQKTLQEKQNSNDIELNNLKQQFNKLTELYEQLSAVNKEKEKLSIKKEEIERKFEFITNELLKFLNNVLEEYSKQRKEMASVVEGIKNNAEAFKQINNEFANKIEVANQICPETNTKDSLIGGKNKKRSRRKIKEGKKSTKKTRKIKRKCKSNK
jgi:hypothetical protein